MARQMAREATKIIGGKFRIITENQRQLPAGSRISGPSVVHWLERFDESGSWRKI